MRTMPYFRRSRSDGAYLLFPQTGQPQGFATLATTQWDGNPEPVVRELLQNALDAATRAKCDRCEVSFTIRDVALEDIPGIAAYRKHFKYAVAERRGKPQGAAEKTIVSRIRNVLKADRIRILLCRDNGIGLSEDSMLRLLTEGNTDKEDAGAGAFGVGHLTAFAASDTRYMLYAGRSRNGDGGHNVVSSAHAMLASRTVKDSGGIRGLGAHGYWLARRKTDRGLSGEQLGLFDPKYPDSAPLLIEAELQRLRDTGSVVCITGFNGFRSEEEASSDAIAKVSAKNFLVAIQRQEMAVRICDETGGTAKHHVVDAHRLNALLRKERTQKRTKSGWLPGEQAYRCLRTLVEGQPVPLKCGATAKVRMLGSSEGTSSYVQLFRNGMWITNRADSLTPPHFAGFNPFDAVITISDGEIGKLVREAEGPEHRGLDRRRLRDGNRKKRLLEILREIKRELQEHVGEIPKAKDYAPEDFAIFGGSGERVAEAVPPYRPRAEPPSPGNDSDGTTPRPSDDEDAGTIDGRRRKPRGKGGGAKPKAGKSVSGRLAVVAAPSPDGRVDTFRVYWKPDHDQTRRGEWFSARVRIPSGSDATCELPVGPKWLRIRDLSLAESTGVVGPHDDGFEVRLPHGTDEFTLRLAEPVTATDVKAIEIDIVRRTDVNSESGSTPEKS